MIGIVQRTFLTCLVLSLAFVAGAADDDDDTERELLRGKVEQVAAGMNPRIGSATIASVHVIPRLYETRSFRLAWTDSGNVEELIELLEESHEEGLDPEDYHLSTLRSLVAETKRSDAPGLRAALDIVLTDALTRLGGIDVIVASERSQTFEPEPFLLMGIDVTRYDIVALKSSNHFRAGFQDLAGAIVTADPPGLTTHRIEIFARERAPGPLWPLDPDTVYSPQSG